MYIKENYKEISSSIDVSALKAAVLSTPTEEWTENQFRQKKFEVATEVETILFKMNGREFEGVGDNPELTHTFEAWDKWEHLVQPVIDEVIKYYPDHETAFINKCMLPNMKPNTKIPTHRDSMKSFKDSHRIHVPLQTNDEVYFMINGERCVMEVGKAYEVNNLLWHGVENKGATDRIHLLFDLYIPKHKGN